MKRTILRRRSLWRQRIPRRDVVSLLITGGAVTMGVAGMGTALVGILTKLRQSSPDSPPRSGGASIGSMAQPRNSAIPFRNPHDNKHSLLVRLPSGTFVAYEQGCPHRGVLVTYDPATHQLVCPAHGARFDPAQRGKVLQGPATQALPQVAIRIHADGTITAL